MFVPLYIALGWVAVTVLPDLARSAPAYANVLLFVGGVLHHRSGRLRHPQTRPRARGCSGYHEVFHLLTIVAASCHAVAIASIVL